jgi:hypothetical protein
MSEEGDKRRAAFAARLASSKEEHGVRKKQYELDKKIKKALKELAPIFKIPISEINKAWREDENPVHELKHRYELSGISDFHLYPTAIPSFTELVSETLKDSGLWKCFIKQYTGSNCPLIVFGVKRNGLWVLTNKSPRQLLSLVPRIRVYSKGRANDVTIMPLKIYVKENIHE